MSKLLKPVRFISPSSFYYWEKCPLRVVFAENYRGIRTFPIHPDSALGTVIHSFYENKGNWGINDSNSFEAKWAEEIEKINNQFLNDKLQSVYFPIQWHSKYYAVKKTELRANLVKTQNSFSYFANKASFEKWLDDGSDIGGKIDFVRYNEKKEIVEIVDFKTGSVFEVNKRKKKIKNSFRSQLALYAYLVLVNQSFTPKCFVQNNRGEKFEIKVCLEEIKFIRRKAIELKNKVNASILENKPYGLACPTSDNCSFCNYRPICESYKKVMINDFTKKTVDVYGKIVRIIDARSFVLSTPEKVLTLKKTTFAKEIKEGDMAFVYNLFCPDPEARILFATKSTIITYE